MKTIEDAPRRTESTFVQLSELMIIKSTFYPPQLNSVRNGRFPFLNEGTFQKKVAFTHSLLCMYGEPS